MTSELIIERITNLESRAQETRLIEESLAIAVGDLTNALERLKVETDKAIVSINDLSVRLDEHELNTEHKDEWECAECQQYDNC